MKFANTRIDRVFCHVPASCEFERAVWQSDLQTRAMIALSAPCPLQLNGATPFIADRSPSPVVL
jgi:hypothetical protein